MTTKNPRYYVVSRNYVGFVQMEVMGLDQMTPLEIVTVMNREDGKAVDAVGEVLPQIAHAIAWCTDSLKQKGRIIYIGAGTASGMPGRLAAGPGF